MFSVLRAAMFFTRPEDLARLCGMRRRSVPCALLPHLQDLQHPHLGSGDLRGAERLQLRPADPRLRGHHLGGRPKGHEPEGLRGRAGGRAQQGPLG